VQGSYRLRDLSQENTARGTVDLGLDHDPAERRVRGILKPCDQRVVESDRLLKSSPAQIQSPPRVRKQVRLIAALISATSSTEPETGT
jgi:hypothetical protein